MRLSTRLLLPLLATVVTVMSVYAAWSLRQRETTLSAQDRREARAYANALGLALEAAFRDPLRRDVQETIDRISREPNIYGVVIYDRLGVPIYLAGPLEGATGEALERIRTAVSEGDTTSFNRLAGGGERVFSVVRSLRGPDGEVVAGFEVLQPLAFMESEKARTRVRFLLNTLTLLLALTILILLLVRRFVGDPLARLVDGVRALEAGDLAWRVPADPGGGELAEVASEFNRMADRLEAARAELMREAEDRVALERRLRDTEKLAAVGNLAASVAHEIAAPLHVIQGRAELLRRKAGSSQAEVRNLSIITEQIRRITAIVRNLLDFARRREPRIHPVDLVHTLDGVVEFLEGEFTRARITLERQGPPSLQLEADGELLFQVFMNLLLNAIHALEDHDGERCIRIGAWRVEGRSDDSGGRPELAGDGPRVRIELEDTGPGIEEAQVEQVFEPFFTTKMAGVGTGLGLPVVRSIVAEHGGAVDVVRGGRGGACFRLVLPVSGPRAAPPPEAQAPGRPATSTGRRRTRGVDTTGRSHAG